MHIKNFFKLSSPVFEGYRNRDAFTYLFLARAYFQNRNKQKFITIKIFGFIKIMH